MRGQVPRVILDEKFLLAVGAVLLSAAVTLAQPPLPQPWPADVGGVVHQAKTCVQEFKNYGVGNANSPVCTHYQPGACYAVAGRGDIEPHANNNPFFQVDQWRAFGGCQPWFGSGGVNATCTEYPWFTCARINFYAARNGAQCVQPTQTGFWVAIANSCDPAA